SKVHSLYRMMRGIACGGCGTLNRAISFPAPAFFPYLGSVHPIAFQFGSFTITWYGVMVAMGFLAGLWVAARRAMRENIPSEKIYDLGPWLILGSILGARSLYVITFWGDQFANRPFTDIFKVWKGGLVYY